MVKIGPSKEVLIREKEADLRKEVPQIHWEEKYRPYIISGLSFTKDPETRMWDGTAILS